MNRNLIAYRRMLNISQEDMAKVAGICVTSYNSREKERKPFTQNEMLKIILFLKSKGVNTTIDELFFKNKVSILET